MIYFDNNATTPVDPRVASAMLAPLQDQYGNPASVHHAGMRAAALVEAARTHLAQLIGSRAPEIVFTSGGTEANNAALRGVLAARPERRHLVISAVEHHAVLEPAEQLAREGVAVTQVPVDRDGRLDLEHLTASLRDDTALVSVMLANNETGAIYPLREIARLAHARGALVHTDAVNALGKMSVNVADLDVDLASFSAHKLHGPQGIGALFIRGGTPFRPALLGGPHERRRRAGTLNTPGIVGFGTACKLARELGTAPLEEMRSRRERLEDEIRRRYPQALIVGAAAPRLPNTTCLCLPGVSGEALLMLLSEEGVCASAGAACSSGSLQPSHVLRAMGLDERLAHGQVRFSLSRFNTDAEIDQLVAILPRVIDKVSAIAVP